jgi:hypothetical protein
MTDKEYSFSLNSTTEREIDEIFNDSMFHRRPQTRNKTPGSSTYIYIYILFLFLQTILPLAIK